MDTPANSPMEALTAFNQRMLQQVTQPLSYGSAAPATPEIVQSLAAALAKDTQRWADIQNRFYQKQLELWSSFSSQSPDAPPPKVVEPEPGDRRFRGPEWQQPYFSFLAQSYLLNAKWLQELVETAQLDPQAKKKLSFYARQYIDAISPANFPWSNPEAVKLAAETQGDSVARGLRFCIRPAGVFLSIIFSTLESRRTPGAHGYTG